MSEAIYQLRSFTAWLLQEVLLRTRHGLRWLHDRLAPAELVVTEHAVGFWRTGALFAATELGVAEHLAERPKTLIELSQEIGCEPGLLERLLAPLVSSGFFRRTSCGHYANNRLSVMLLQPCAQSFGQCKSTSLAAALRFQHQVQWQNWQNLGFVVQNAKTSVQKRNSRWNTLFDALADSPAEQELFHAAMQSLTSLANREILSAYPWHKHRMLIDLGGGQGAFARNIGDLTHKVKTAVLDLPHAFANAADKGSPPGPYEIIQGSFFELKTLAQRDSRVSALFDKADLFTLKHILHDWSDEECVAILRQVRAVMAKDATLVVIETLKNPARPDLVGSYADLEMMHSFQSKERTKIEYEKLFTAADFCLQKVIHTLSPFVLLVCEAMPDR